MSKSKSDSKRFVTVFQTDKNGKFKFEFREVTKDDIRTVAYVKEASWEEVSSCRTVCTVCSSPPCMKNKSH